MAYTQVIIDQCLNLFIEGYSMEEISRRTNIPIKTLYNWKNKNDWASYLRVGNIEIARAAEQELYKLVKKMIENESIGDPAQVDKLVKLTKALERISPNRQILNSLFRILEGVTDYVNRAGDEELTKVWQKHLRPIGQHLKLVFSPEE